jgi:hypothetical protein
VAICSKLGVLSGKLTEPLHTPRKKTEDSWLSRMHELGGEHLDLDALTNAMSASEYFATKPTTDGIQLERIEYDLGYKPEPSKMYRWLFGNHYACCVDAILQQPVMEGYSAYALAFSQQVLTGNFPVNDHQREHAMVNFGFENSQKAETWILHEVLLPKTTSEPEDLTVLRRHIWKLGNE